MPKLANFALGILLLSSSAYAEPPKPSIKILQDAPVSGNDAVHAVTIMVDWPLGTATGMHTHPGDEYAVVLEGAVEITTKDQGTKIYQAGEAYHNAKNAAHTARAVGDKPAKTIATLIIDKGKPLSQPVK